MECKLTYIKSSKGVRHMAGCYGTSQEDKHFEAILDKHLDSVFLDSINTCIVCREEYTDDDIEHDAEHWLGIDSKLTGPIICKGCAVIDEVIEKWELNEI
jgi:hypothetical protein